MKEHYIEEKVIQHFDDFSLIFRWLFIVRWLLSLFSWASVQFPCIGKWMCASPHRNHKLNKKLTICVVCAKLNGVSDWCSSCRNETHTSRAAKSEKETRKTSEIFPRISRNPPLCHIKHYQIRIFWVNISLDVSGIEILLAKYTALAVPPPPRIEWLWFWWTTPNLLTYIYLVFFSLRLLGSFHRFKNALWWATKMKEMVGGCCVCSDERGWPENPLVYCDGQNCTVAVHQACYGIVTVPTGPWYCRKCESQERSARVRCELCPSRDGALKRTDTQSWAHVVCALYIPEVRFGNVTTMEPIILQIPPERFSKGKR